MSQRPTEFIELTIEKLIPGGDGLARHEGKVVFIPGVLPEEKILAEIIESKKDFSRAELKEILKPSDQRQEPPCKVAGECGGCDWQHITYAEQLKQKIALTQDSLSRIGKITFPNLEIISGQPFAYRNRIQIQENTEGQKGFLAKQSHRLIEIETCPIALPSLNTYFQKSALALQSSSPLQSPSDKPSPVKQKSNRATKPWHTKEKIPAFKRIPAWAHTQKSGPEFLIAGEAGSLIPGFSAPILNKKIHFDLRCFFQSNLAMLEKLLPFILDDFKNSKLDLALDLYCGVGLFGAFLKDYFSKILAVEENRIALDYAKKNIGLDHTFLTGKLEDLLASQSQELINSTPDLILVDPPRPGLDEVVRKFLIDKGAPRLIYISCNPVTLARDLKILLENGYILQDLRLFDFYPQTAHIEAVAKLKKA